MKKVIIVFLLLLTHYGLTYAQFSNGDFENISCPTDCSIANSQMSCVPDWEEFGSPSSNQYPLQKAFCPTNNEVCNGNYSLLLTNFSSNPVVDVKTANPISNANGYPQVIRFTAKTLSRKKH